MPAVVNFDPEPYSVEFREVPLPEIGENDVLLAVKAVGICGSDLHQWCGHPSWQIHYPVILGHEFSGVAARTGDSVKSFSEGDRVVSETAAVIDPRSPYSRQGLYQLDPSRLGFGYGVDGAMTQYVRVPERCLHAIPEHLPFTTAALTEPCCVAFNAVCINSPIKPGDNVAVIGPGPIGLLCVVMAHLAGAGHILVVGTPSDRERLAIARKVGANTVLEGDLEEVQAWTESFHDGLGFDLVIDAAGVSPTLQLALQIVRPAGHITKVGWGPQPLDFSLDPLVQKAVSLQGSFSHNWPVWEKVIALLGNGRINLEPILNKISPLEDWQDAFKAMQSGSIVKAVLTP